MFWDFGESFTSTVRNPAHTYATAGNYVVTLTASNLGGARSPATRTIMVVRAPIRFLPTAYSYVQQEGSLARPCRRSSASTSGTRASAAGPPKPTYRERK